ncbi:MAG TPA: type III pantothenate kinase [Gammaproteobacteria bacterium]|nr:type III pantothenate kinase [Gammaproteobacteria bacterium]
MAVLVDIGNTRIKWALLERGRLTGRGSAVHRDSLDAAIAALDAALPAKPQIIASNVAGDVAAARLEALVAARPGASLELVSTSAERFGVRCAYADPSRLGVDRWVAVLAAHHAQRARAACVLSAGTAVTFDAVDAAGLHLGGLIIPGASLLAAALDRHTSNIGRTAPATAVPEGLELLGRNTDKAVGHGAWLAIAAALDRAVATIADALRTTPVVYLTGGDADALRGWLATRVELRADLVLEGLQLFAGARAEAGR